MKKIYDSVNHIRASLEEDYVSVPYAICTILTIVFTLIWTLLCLTIEPHRNNINLMNGINIYI